MITTYFLATVWVKDEHLWLSEIVNADYSYTISGIKNIWFFVDNIGFPISGIEIISQFGHTKRVKCLTLYENIENSQIELNKYYPLTQLGGNNIGKIKITKIL